MQKLSLFLFLVCIVLIERGDAEESWGAALFPTKQHDFGQVALGADAEFRFELTNIYDREVKLLNVRSSCGCTAAQLSTSLLQSGDTGAVIVRFNTSGQHLRSKSAVLTVQLETVISGTRKIDTVQLFVSGYIRPDVLLTPGRVEFGAVSEGTVMERTLQLEYTGHSGWALTKVVRSLPFIYAKAEEVRREQGTVVYAITVTLKEGAPVGYVKDILRFTTNEMQPGRTGPVEIDVPIQGVVTSALHAAPSPMLIGVLTPGETATKSIVVRSDTPFRITNIAAADKRFRFAFSDHDSVVQLISVSFSARFPQPDQPQDVTEAIRISTNDSRQDSVTVQALVRLIPAW